MSGLLDNLVDDAGLFPPESLPMGRALERHLADEQAGDPMLTHRFLCPASRLAELRAAPELERWTATPSRPRLGNGPGLVLRLGLILDTGVDGLAPARAGIAADRRLQLELVEAPAPSAEAVTGALDALAGVDEAVYVEGPRQAGWGWVKALAARPGPGVRGAKVRCGGGRAELFPTPEELAGFLCACAADSVGFKATAGLHGAVRHRDGATGFVHHGFLNLVLGTVRAVSGAAADSVAEVLACEDPDALVAEYRAVPAAPAQRARALLSAYGSCSTGEPREEAAALGLVAPPAP
ncbi:MAG TPA: hypothetical protein VHL53_23185 [Acidimicrobiia bacterium]|nr:hypothetical protein [Acidimicrobiia bacterium]